MVSAASLAKASLNARKYLIIGPSWVGDMVMAQCLFKLLKLKHPQASIDVLAPPWTFSILSCMPEVDHAIKMPIQHGELKLKDRFALAQTLKQQRYTHAVVLPNSFKSALIPFFARIPQRTGWSREGRQFFLLNDARTLDKKAYPLMIEQYMALALAKAESLPKPYPKPSFQVTVAQQRDALATYNLKACATQAGKLSKTKQVLAICAGAEFGPSKRWPPAYYAQVAQQQLNQDWDVWLFGSSKDAAIADEIMQLTGNRCVNLTGKTTLADSIALLSTVNCVISNDSGLMHIAAALNKPLIAIYGSTSPAFTPPLSDHAVILQKQLTCQPCFQRECPLKHHRCMREITPTEVCAAIQNHFQCGK